MFQASNLSSKLALSLFMLMASSGAVLAQQVKEDRPAVSYPAQASGAASAPSKPASVTINAPAERPAPAKASAEVVHAVAAPITPEAAPKAAAPKRKVVAKKVHHAATPAAKPVAKEVDTEQLKFKAPLPGEVEVSDRDYNHFIFPSAITQLVFPPGAPVVGKPVYLNNNTQALVEIQRGADKPIQMIVETEAGRVTKLYLKPRPINGITFRVDGAREAGAATARTAAAKGSDVVAGAPHGDDIELLKHAVQGDIPSDFESIALPRPTRFDRFTVVPLAGWSNGSRRIMSFSLVAVPGKTAIVSDPQFYRPGITAVLLTGDHVDESSNPQLYVVEEVSNDE